MLTISGGEPRYPAETSTPQPAYVVTPGAGLVIPVLAAFQRLRAELADHGVPVERWAILTLPVAGSDQPVLVLDRSAATLLSLEIASRAGVSVGGRRLTVPLAEYAFLIDEAGPPPWSVEAQRDYAGDVLRKVAQTGRPGEAIRQSIRRQPRPDPSVESWVLQSIRFGSPTSNHRTPA
jgi:hypothetical protein